MAQIAISDLKYQDGKFLNHIPEDESDELIRTAVKRAMASRQILGGSQPIANMNLCGAICTCGGSLEIK